MKAIRSSIELKEMIRLKAWGEYRLYDGIVD